MFEGSEKKLEMFFSPVMVPLRYKKKSFWDKLCSKASARIISSFSNSFCDSYILSESSLFVWDHRLLILTCGNTSLVSAILSLLKHFKKEDVELLFYQRKNELFPYSQKTSFIEDLEKIKRKIPGQAFGFGSPDEHHFRLFHSSGRAGPMDSEDRTVEILMYDLDDHIKNLFFKSQSAQHIRKTLGLDGLFPHAQVDDYLFKPHGYSLNGLIGKNQYYTIHVTPQEPGFYVSFETNFIEESVEEITKKLIALFKPLSVDVIVFSAESSHTTPYKPQGMERSSYFTKNLQCGYKVDFSGFYTPYEHPRPAYEVV